MARRRLRAELIAAGVLEHVVDDATLVLSELVGNAVVHGRPLAGGEIEIAWRADDGGIHVEITDGGGLSAPRQRQAGELSPSGRGLAIVARLADGWGVDQGPERLTVWARLRHR